MSEPIKNENLSKKLLISLFEGIDLVSDVGYAPVKPMFSEYVLLKAKREQDELTMVIF